MEKLLGKIYYDPKEGFMGINNLYRKAKKKDKTIKMKDVEKWLKQQSVGQVHTRKSDQIEYLPIMSFTPGHFQMDLTDMELLLYTPNRRIFTIIKKVKSDKNFI